MLTQLANKANTTTVKTKQWRENSHKKIWFHLIEVKLGILQCS